MSAPPPGTPRKIFFGGETPEVPTPIESEPAQRRQRTDKTGPILPPPPWKKSDGGEVQFAQPNAQAGVVVDIGELQARIDRNLAKLTSDAALSGERFAALDAAFASSRDAALAASASTLNTDRSRIEALHDEKAATLEQRHVSSAGTALDDAARLIEALAPAGASAPWTAENWDELVTASTVSDHYRIGTLPHDDGELAALAPLAPGGGWYLDGDAASAHELLLATVLRIVATAPAANLAIETFDPRMSATLGPLAPLRNVNGRAFPPPQTQSEAFTARIEAIIAQASLNAERVVSGGARSLTELWRAQSAAEGTLTVVAVLDYPYGIDEAAQRALLKLAALGPAAGAIVIVQDSGATPASDRIVPAELRAELLGIRTDGRSVVAHGLPGHLTVNRDPAPTTATIDTVLRAVKERTERGAVVTLPLEELLVDELATPWQHSAIHALEATIGRAGKDPLELVLGTSKPPHAFALIGGATGTGKSNLLMAVIYSLAVKYGPDQLALYLLDFKQGLEFKQFDANAAGIGWLPHAKILSLESDQQFGIAVLEDIIAEIERRAELFKNAGDHKSYDQYVAATGARLERLLIVIDEFHVLFEEQSDATDHAVSLLETIVRQARAFGVHLILASQTTSGIAGLARKGDSIYSQIAVRMSLKNNVAESRAILSNDNTAATTLAARGEVILNRDFGMNPELSNQRGLIAYVQPERFKAVQQQLWDRSHGLPPLVFSGRQPAEWDLDELGRLRSGGEALELWVGRPISTERTPATLRLRPEVDQAIAVVGPDRDRGPALPGLITGMIVSAAHQLGPADEIVVLNGYGDSAPEWLYPAIDHVEDLGIRIRIVAAPDSARVLRDELATRTRDAANRMLVLSLATQRIPDLDLVIDAEKDTEPDPSGTDQAPTVPEGEDHGGLLSMSFPAGGSGTSAAPGEPARSGREALRLLATEGGLRGIGLIAAWSNAAGIQADLGFDHAGVQVYLTVGLGGDDLKTVSGEYQPRIDGWPRIGLADRNASIRLRPIVPFRAWDQELQQRMEAAQ